MIPHAFEDIASAAIAAAKADERFLGITMNGSGATGETDEYSDLDLVLVCTDEHHPAVLAEAKTFAAGLGTLLTSFTGEHVGEPRLLIALYDGPVRHVDLKFVGLSQLGHRVEDGVVVWERDDAVTAALARTSAVWPRTDPQWSEDRFWVWVHYVAGKIGRGELFDAMDALTWIRAMVIAPLAVGTRVDRPSGVRRIETIRPDLLPALTATSPRIRARTAGAPSSRSSSCTRPCATRPPSRSARRRRKRSSTTSETRSSDRRGPASRTAPRSVRRRRPDRHAFRSR